MVNPKLIDTDGLAVFKDECDKAYLAKVTLAAVATSGSYTDLSNKPTIPTVPKALKNPNALTFTGAVTGSYDGSAAKSVNIPAAPDLTPYMKKTADSDLNMGSNAISFSIGGSISSGRLNGRDSFLIIGDDNTRGVNIMASDNLYVDGVRVMLSEEIERTYAPKASPTFTGTVTAVNVTVSTSLTIPGGKVWIE